MSMPLERNIPRSNVVVLFIHGIMGTPEHFDFLLPLLPENWSYRRLWLSGHGKGLAEFNHAAMAQWRAQVREAVVELSTEHERLLVVTHSMGGLLALDAASACPGAVDALFALALPLKILPHPAAGANALKVALGRVRPGDAMAMDAQRCCGVAGDRQLWRYLGAVPRYLELFALSRQVRRALPAPELPLEAWFSSKDELVSVRAAGLLADRKETFVHFLPNSGHYHYPAQDLDRLRSAFSAFCGRYQ